MSALAVPQSVTVTVAPIGPLVAIEAVSVESPLPREIRVSGNFRNLTGVQINDNFAHFTVDGNLATRLGGWFPLAPGAVALFGGSWTGVTPGPHNLILRAVTAAEVDNATPVTVPVNVLGDIFTFGDVELRNTRIVQTAPDTVNYEVELVNVSAKTAEVIPIIAMGTSTQSGSILLGPGESTGLIPGSFRGVPIGQVIITFEIHNSINTPISSTVTLSILMVSNPPSTTLPVPPPTFSIGQQVMVRPDSRCGLDAGRTGSVSSIVDIGEPLYSVGFTTGGHNSYRWSENCLVAN